MGRRLSTLLGSALALSGCQPPQEVELSTCVHPPVSEAPDLPLQAQTEFIDIYSPPGESICLGTQLDFDRQVRDIQSVFGHPGEAPPQVVPYYYVGTGSTTPDCSSATGCTFNKDGLIQTKAGAMRHELAHGVACQHRGWAARALAEGFAELYEGPTIRYWGLDEEVPPDFNGDEGNYGSWGWFVYWLRSQYGEEAFVELYERTNIESTAADVEAALLDIYGMTLPEIQEERLEGQPLIRPGYSDCNGPVWEPDEEGVYRASLAFDCHADPETRGPKEERIPNPDPDVMFKRFTVEITKPGQYGLTIPNPSDVLFEPIHIEPSRCYLQPAYSVDGYDPVGPSAHPGSAEGVHRFTTPLTEGTWQIDVVVRQSAGPQTFDVTFEWEAPLDEG